MAAEEKRKKRLFKIEKNIKKAGFKKFELLRFKRDYLEVKKIFNPDITKEVTIRTVIANSSYDSFSSVSLFFYSFILFFIFYIILGDFEGFLLMFFILLVMTAGSIIYRAKDNKIEVVTEVKLIALYIRSFF